VRGGRRAGEEQDPVGEGGGGECGVERVTGRVTTDQRKEMTPSSTMVDEMMWSGRVRWKTPCRGMRAIKAIRELARSSPVASL